jgi:hypothetical protein
MARATRWNHLKHAAVSVVAQGGAGLEMVLKPRRKFETVLRAIRFRREASEIPCAAAPALTGPAPEKAV